MIQYINFKYKTLEECTQKTNELLLMYKEIINTEIIKETEGWSTILKLDIQNEFEMFKELRLLTLKAEDNLGSNILSGLIRTIFNFKVVDIITKKNIEAEIEILKDRKDICIILRYLQNDISIASIRVELIRIGIENKYKKWNIRRCKIATYIWDKIHLDSEELDEMGVKEINENHIQMMNMHIRNGLLQLGILLDEYSKDELEYRVRQVIEAMVEKYLNEV